MYKCFKVPLPALSNNLNPTKDPSILEVVRTTAGYWTWRPS